MSKGSKTAEPNVTLNPMNAVKKQCQGVALFAYAYSFQKDQLLKMQTNVSGKYGENPPTLTCLNLHDRKFKL